jgi:integrase
VRIPKPFFRSQTKTWYVQIGNKQHNLGPDEQAAKEKYHVLMLGRQPVTDETTVCTVLYLFLEWCKKNNAASSHEQYRHYIQSFAKSIGDQLTVQELTPQHVTDWVENEYGDKSDNTQRNAIRSIQRALNWAVEEKKLKSSPIAKMRKPAYVPRDTIISPEQWTELVTALAARDGGQAFLELITLMRQTGCRPLEARTAEAKHLDKKNRCLVFEREKSKGYNKHAKQIAEQRVIPLTDEMFAMCERLALKYPEGPLLRNGIGTPWTSHSIHRWCQRLDQSRYEKPSPTRVSFRLTVYSIRHTWATEALERGVDPVTVATIMGHKDLNMLMKVYQHLKKKQKYLREALMQANGQIVPVTPAVAVPA